MKDLEVQPPLTHVVNGERKVIDIVLRRGHAQILLEITAFPTNYATRSGGGGKAITDVRNAVRGDLTQRGQRVSGPTLSYVLRQAYPIPIPDYRRSEWRVNHYNPIS